MIKLSIQDILRLHTKLTARTGGSNGVRDMGLLESAVYSADTGFGGIEVYPTVCEKAARLMYALTANHAFVDGNKRIGLLVMLTMLRLNNICLNHTQQELIDLSLHTAQGTLSYESILAWVHAHMQNKAL